MGTNLEWNDENPKRHIRFRRTKFGVDKDDGNDMNVDDNHHHRLHHREDDGEVDLDREVDSIVRRRRRSSAAILQFLQGIREGINSDHESSVIGDYSTEIKVTYHLKFASAVVISRCITLCGTSRLLN